MSGKAILRTFATLFLSLFLLKFSYAQNLVPNPSFEGFSTCPTGYNGICDGFGPPWSCPTLGSSDLFNACGNPSMAGVPDNAIGNQAAQTGVGYGGFIGRWSSPANYREYLMVQLSSPLIADAWYYVTFYLSVADSGCGIEHVGAYFSNGPVFQGNFFTLPFTPQVESNDGFISESNGWELIGGCFQAVGGEQYITIGNFHDDSETPLDPACSGSYNYFYIDDVSVTEGLAPEEIPLDLGGPIEECFSYEIDPNHDGPIFQWSDGSGDPTLVVTESGTYTLTVTDGCNLGIDSIEVIINGNYPPVDVGPDEVTICNGEEYTISLDPDLYEYTWQDGSDDPEYVITTTGIYSVTLDDGCLVTSDAIDVTVLDPPLPFTLGEDTILCFGDEFTISFDPILGDFMWQDNSSSSSFLISEGGTYSLTISNICGMESDEIEVSDLDVPEVEIGPDETTICSGEILEIEIDPDLGDILWQDGTTEPNYEITTSGIYTVFVTNECGTGSDQVEVDVVISPNVELGPDTILCEGETLLLTTNEPGPYLWQDNSTENQFLVTGPGTYSLSISNFCGTASDIIDIEYIPLIAPVDFGPDVSLCPGEQLVLHANNPGAGFLWQDFSTADTFLVTTSGTYHVQVFNDCSIEADTIIVVVNDSPPQLNLPAQVTLCQGQDITLDAAIGGVTYLWNDNTSNQQLLVTSAGTYSLTVSNACGTDADTTIVLDGGPAPLVELGNDVQLCAGDILTLSPVFSDVNTWLWQDGSTLPTYNVSGAGTVSVEVNNACGTSYDTLQATLLPATPPLDLGNDTSLCSGESFVLTITTPGITILWPDGSSNSNYTVTNTGIVYAEISNSCGTCFDTIQVDALPDVPILNLGNDQSLCPGEIISLDPGISNVQYLWQDGSTGNTYQSTQEETIILTITNECGSSTDTVEITESTQGPQLDLGQDIQVCAGEIVTIESGISGVSFVWQDGSTDPDFVTSQSGIFYLDVTNNCGSATDTIVVDISGVPPTPVLGPDTTLCEGISLILASTANAETTIEWQDGSSNSTYSVNTSGTYILSESNRCGDAADTVVVAFLDAPDSFSLGSDTTLCPGESLTLTVPSTAYEILWQDGSDAKEMIADQPITYSLQLSNDCGTVSDELELSFDDRTILFDPDTSIPWCEGDVITLDASQPFDAEYLWSTGVTTPSVQITSPGLYSVDVATPCTSATMEVDVFPGTDCMVIEVHNDVYIPNVFSPNTDGINDFFFVSVGADLNVLAMEGNIYDRWGNLVYGSKETSFSWDGFFNNELMMPGVYAYVISITYLDELQKERVLVFAGDVTLIR
jgi:gliding motility-associated-like protein